MRVRKPVSSLSGLAEVELLPPRLVWAVLAGRLPRCSRGGLLLRAFGEAVAAEVTSYSLHAGTVRSCIFRILTVHTPDASLHSLQSPIVIVTMSRSMSNLQCLCPAQSQSYHGLALEDDGSRTIPRFGPLEPNSDSGWLKPSPAQGTSTQ